MRALRALRRAALLTGEQAAAWSEATGATAASTTGRAGQRSALHTGRWPLATHAAQQLQQQLSQQPRLARAALRQATAGAPAAPLLRRALQTSARLADAVEVTVPPMGDSISEGTIAAVLKQPGDSVAPDDIIAQIETDKVTIDVKYTGTAPGAIGAVLVKDGDTVVVGQPVARVDQGAAGAAPAAAAAPPPPKPAAAAPPPPPKPAAPKAEAPKPAARPASPAAPAGEGDGKPLRPERRVKMTRLRMRVSERLKGAQNTYAMLTTFNEIDMSGIMDMRNKYKDAFFEMHGCKLGFMSAFVKAAATALQEVPAVNAVIDGTDIVYRDYVDISIAVATPKGLVVPVLRGADELDFAEVERNISDLGRKARDGLLSIDEMAGGTFTISNGGVYGSLFGTPIINPPQSAILGMHSIVQRPMVVGKSIEARPMMYVALTYDHRLIDGREAVTFLKRIKEVVEDPRRLLLGV